MALSKTKIQRDIELEVFNTYKIKNIEDIKIIDICKNLGIPRTTFYYHFDSPRGALVSYENEFLKGLDKVYDRKLLPNVSQDQIAFSRMINATRDYLFDHYDFLETVLVKRPDPVFIKNWTEIMASHYRYIAKGDELRLMIEVNAIIVFFQYSIEHKIRKEDLNPEELVRHMINALTSENKLLQTK